MVLLELIERQLGILELFAQVHRLLAQPAARRARSFELVVEVSLDVGVSEGVRDPGGAFGIQVVHDQVGDARLLHGNDLDRAQQSRDEILAAGLGSVVARLVLPGPQAIENLLRDFLGLNDPVLGLEVRVRVHLHVHDALDPLEDARCGGLDDDRAGGLVDSGLPYRVNEGDGPTRDEDGGDHFPALAQQVDVVPQLLGGGGGLRR